MYPALMCLGREAFFLVVSGMEQWEAVKSGVVGPFSYTEAQLLEEIKIALWILWMLSAPKTPGEEDEGKLNL